MTDRTAIPAPTEELVLRSLAKDPADRFPSAAALRYAPLAPLGGSGDVELSLSSGPTGVWGPGRPGRRH